MSRDHKTPRSNKITKYFEDSWQELKKVTWPTKNQAFKITVIVLGFCFGMAFIIGLLDFAFNTGYKELKKLSDQYHYTTPAPVVTPDNASTSQVDINGTQVKATTDVATKPVVTTEVPTSQNN